jgi:F-type H+-transporting ATPase subunit b
VELSWSTFILEIINFLVLLWILRRFLYRPVLDVIARRKARIEQTLAESASIREEATALQSQYEARLADWEKERQTAREALTQELERERARRLIEMQTELDQQREKSRVSESHRQADIEQKLEETALAQAAKFATRLLEQASGPELETRLIEMVINELSQLSEDRVSALRNGYGTAPEPIVVNSAFPVSDDQRQRLAQALGRATGTDDPLQLELDTGLLAGLRITRGPWVIAANLRDELEGFAVLTRDR